MVTFLTKSAGWLGPIASILGLIMNAIYEFFHMFGIQNIALSIIVFTFIVRTLMLPLTIKQQKFSKLSSRMNPEIQKIQAKYKGKKDETSLRKQQEETQIVYQKYGANPTSGCLPILITLPVMFALYSVINNIPAYVGQVKELYETVAVPISNVKGYEGILATLADGLRLSSTDFSTVDQIINVLTKFQTTHWNSLMDSMPGIKDTIAISYDQIKQVNSFLGMNIANAPGWRFPGILIPILAMVLQFVQGKQLEVKTKGNNQDPTANAMKSMNYVMPVMSGFFCVTFPTGVGIYWIATSVYAIIQQFFVNKYMDRVDVDELIEKNVAKASKRKPRISNNNVSKSVSLEELAKKQTRYIATDNKFDNSENNGDSGSNDDRVSSENHSSSGNPKSISEIANLLKSRNSEKGDK